MRAIESQSQFLERVQREYYSKLGDWDLRIEIESLTLYVSVPVFFLLFFLYHNSPVLLLTSSSFSYSKNSSPS